MKKQGGKRFTRKKFFYRFFMRESPRSGAMYGLAWMSMTAGILPFVFFLALTCFSELQYGWKVIAVVLSSLLLAAPFYIYGFLLCSSGICRIYRTVTRCKVVSSIAGAIGACCLPLLGVVLVPVLICKKKFAGVLFATGGTVFYFLSYSRYSDIHFPVFPGTLCYLAALAFCKDKKRFSWKFTAPIAIAAVSCLLLLGGKSKLQHDVRNHREQLSQIIGHSIETEDLRHRDAQGFPLDKEPLKSLIACNPVNNQYQNFAYKNVDEYENSETARQKLLAYNETYPDFVKSLTDFLQLPVSHVAHEIPEGEMFYSVSTPENSAFRESARYLALNIVANPRNKQLITKCNGDLIKLRTWLLQHDFFFSYMNAIAIERIRLNAISAILNNSVFSKEEFAKLIGETVDWEKFLHHAYGAEATSFESGFDFHKMFALTGYYEKYFDPRVKYLPLFMDLHFLRDYRFALQSFIKACTVPPASSGLEKAELAEADDSEMKRNFYILSRMFLPSLGGPYIATARIEDFRRMALLAAGVMEYRKKNGVLPDTLSFLPEVPLSELDHQPLKYETTADGFRIFSNTAEGKTPDAGDTFFSCHVRLEK